MSRFIAHTISFSKDFKTFRLKGGDNNVVPRYNSWTNDIPFMHLYNDINGGMVELKGTSEKNALIRAIVAKHRYDGAYYIDWVENYNKEVQYPEFVKFNEDFKKDLIKTLKEDYSNKKEYIIKHLHGTYIQKARRTNANLTYNIDHAQKFTKYRALEISENYSATPTKVIIK